METSFVYCSIVIIFEKEVQTMDSRTLGSKQSVGDFPGCPVVKTSPSSAGGAGSISGRGAKIPHALLPRNQNIKQKEYCNKFNKNFKNGPHQKKNL